MAGHVGKGRAGKPFGPLMGFDLLFRIINYGRRSSNKKVATVFFALAALRRVMAFLNSRQGRAKFKLAAGDSIIIKSRPRNPK